jgi:hypothetical protein
MIYYFILKGGCRDGEIFIGFQPYDAITLDGKIYAADRSDWVSEDVMDIHLKFRGYMTMEEYLE